MLDRKHSMLNKKQPMLLKKEFVAFRQFSATFPTQIASTFYFSPQHIPTPKKIKRACNPPHGFRPDSVQDMTVFHHDPRRRASANSTFAIGGVSCSADSFVVTESSVLRTGICGKNPAHRKSANRQAVKKPLFSFMLSNSTIFKTDFLCLFAF